MGIITNLKQRPENQKKIFALIAATILTLLIIFVYFPFATNDNQPTATAKQADLSSVSPLQMIKDTFSTAFSNFSDSIDDATTTDNEIIIETVIDNDIVDLEVATGTVDIGENENSELDLSVDDLNTN